jgi:hypothetical protein
MSQTVTVSTSVILAPTSTTPGNYIVYFPNISTNGRLITVRDNDGYASTNHAVILSTTAGARFATGKSQIEINQPFGFITLNSQSSGNYTILNTFAFPTGSAAAFVNQVTTSNLITSTLQMIDVGNQSINTFFTSTGFMYLNSNVMGQVSDQQLVSTVNGLGTAGYISTVVIPPITPALYIITGLTSNQSQESIYTTLGSIVYGQGDAPYTWQNATSGYTFGFANGGFDAVVGNPYIVAVGDAYESASNSSYIQVSIDGSNWNYANTFLSSPQVRLRVSYANGIYHAVGSNGATGGTPTIMWSSDALTWNTSLTTPITPFTNGYARGITYGKGIWVTAGYQTNTAVFSLIHSSNGSNWYTATAGGGLNSIQMWDVAFNGSIFMALTAANSSGGSILTSTDGKSWNLTASPATTLNNGPAAGGYVAANANMWIVTGSNGSPTGQMMFYSLNNGDSWNVVTSFASGSLSRPFWDGSQWWVGYYNPATPAAQGIYYSLDGSNWANTNTASGGFLGGFPRGFAFRNAQSNYSIALLSTVAGLETSFQTSTLIANTITAQSMTVSSLFVNVQVISTTFEKVDNISTMNANFLSAGNAFIMGANISSIIANSISTNQLTASRMGINTSTSQYTLDVNGSAYVSSGLTLAGQVGYGSLKIRGGSNENGMMIYDPGVTNNTGWWVGEATNFAPISTFQIARILNGNPEANNGLFITANGNVGINCNAPQVPLDVSGKTRIIANGTSNYTQYGPSYDSLTIQTTETGYGQTPASIVFKNADNNYPFARIAGIPKQLTSGPYQPNLVFQVGNGIVLNEAMRIQFDGNVGIGTPAPLTNLHVAGALSADPYAQILIQGTGGTPNGALAFSNVSGWGRFAVAGGADQYLTGSLAGDLLIDTRTATKKILLGTNGTVGLVCSNGSIGIGTTSPGTTLDVTGVIRASLQVTAGQDSLGSVSLISGGAGDQRGYVAFNNASGILQGYIGDQGNPGTYISMYVFSGALGYQVNSNFKVDYRLGIGLGSGSPSYPLDVTGSIRGTEYYFQSDENNTTISLLKTMPLGFLQIAYPFYFDYTGVGVFSWTGYYNFINYEAGDGDNKSILLAPRTKIIVTSGTGGSGTAATFTNTNTTGWSQASIPTDIGFTIKSYALWFI